MRINIFLVQLLCALQQLNGSKSTKKNGGSRLKKWAKNCVIALSVNYGANEVVTAGKIQAAETYSLACKYNVPDRNAEVMMNFVMCAKDQDFKKYMFDNSDNCAKIKELYKQAESDGNCAFNTPKFISDGALARFRGELIETAQVAVAVAVENAKKLLEFTKLAYPNDAEKAVVTALSWGRKGYKVANVENAKRVLELTKLAFPKDIEKAVAMALQSEYKDVNAEHPKRVLELTKLAYPKDIEKAVAMALDSEYKDVNVEHAKHLLELTKLAAPGKSLMRNWKEGDVWDETGKAVEMALDSKYKDVNVAHAKRMLELTKIAFPYAMTSKSFFAWAACEAIKPKYNDVNVDKVKAKYQELKSSWSWYRSSEQSIMMAALKMTYPEIVKEDF